MKYMVDIDNTICETHGSDYENSKPYVDRISYMNLLYDQGHEIHYWTARGGSSGKDWYYFTKDQLAEWGVKYTSFNTGKPSYDLWVDDKAIFSESFFT
jgi:hypothetical protein